MKYYFALHKDVKKFLAKHDDITRIFYRKLQVIASNPFQNTLDIKSLTGKKHHYRLRIGKYRFLYEVREQEILIYFYDADSRGDIYR